MTAQGYMEPVGHSWTWHDNNGVVQLSLDLINKKRTFNGKLYWRSRHSYSPREAALLARELRRDGHSFRRTSTKQAGKRYYFWVRTKDVPSDRDW